MTDDDPQRTQEWDPGFDAGPAAAAPAPEPPPPVNPEPAPPAEPSAFERPEVQAGVAFAGAFLFARIFKRLVD